MDKAQAWAIRCMHEASMHDHNQFLTLTYRDEHLPSDGSLEHRDFQLFMKRLRKHFAIFDVTLWQWLPRYYMCGEYGTAGRPHFHVALFGIDFPDKYPWRKSPKSGEQLYRSPQLEKHWTAGNAELGTLTFQSASYIARYCTKLTTAVNSDSPELTREYNRMSLKPGIGERWFHRYHTDIYKTPEHAFVILNGKKKKTPIYYDRLLKKNQPELEAGVKAARQKIARAQAASGARAPGRLAASEKILESKLQQLKRNI